MNTEHFILKDDGKLYHVTMPPEPEHPNTSDFAEYVSYNEAVTAWKEANDSALQSAIDNAVEVSNQEEVREKIEWSGQIIHALLFLKNQTFSLQCSVEIKEESRYEHVYIGQAKRIVEKKALVTFPSTPGEPEQGESDRDNFKTILDILIKNTPPSQLMNMQNAASDIVKTFKLTRKP